MDYNSSSITEKQPVGVIQYLGSSGKVRETFEFSDSDTFMKKVLEENHYGVPMCVYIMKDAMGKSIPRDFMESLVPASLSCRVITVDEYFTTISPHHRQHEEISRTKLQAEADKNPITTEAQRIVTEMRNLKEPNSPHKTHFMVELSRDFLLNDGRTNRLFSVLPYKTLHFSSLNDRKGIFAFVSKDENRDKGIRAPRSNDRIR